MKLITHNDRFHADDVFATAALQLLFGDKITEIIRTRDEEIFSTGDVVYDVGGVFDSEKNRFDHHQAGYNEVRENGIPYSSFGLIWRKWGEEICGDKEAANIIDEKLVQVIDAGDNGFATHDARDESYSSYPIDSMVRSFGPTWKEEDDFDKRFLEVVAFAKQILVREIVNANHTVEAMPVIQKAYDDAEDKRLLIVEEYTPFGSFFKDHPDTLYVVTRNKEKASWRIVTIQEKGFTNRKDLPQTWAGLRDEELQKVTGVEDAIFCHRGLFLAVAESQEGALKMARIALEA